ncbi:MAG: hypothetical protein K5978_02835 [Campylobacter sp.]|nr:hypothetical protein [Campylobacter sp.]
MINFKVKFDKFQPNLINAKIRRVAKISKFKKVKIHRVAKTNKFDNFQPNLKFK